MDFNELGKPFLQFMAALLTVMGTAYAIFRGNKDKRSEPLGLNGDSAKKIAELEREIAERKIREDLEGIVAATRVSVLGEIATFRESAHRDSMDIRREIGEIREEVAILKTEVAALHRGRSTAR